MLSVDGLIRSLRGVFAEPRCRLCGETAADSICAGCRADLPWNRVACPLCAQPQAVSEAHAVGHRCGRCAAQAPPFDAALTAFRYEGAIAGAIQQLKYQADFLAADWLAYALAERIVETHAPLPQLLIPVPLHRARLRRRGFNQALELGRRLARRLALELLADGAQRIRATRDQIGLGAVERRRNLKGAFIVNAAVEGRTVALLDDVMTTGSTLAELARECRRAGAAQVTVWAVARDA